MSRSPSVKDVARLAGVSTATVSRTLNKTDTVSKETRENVLQAARQVGYRVNHSARSLRLQRTGAVAVLIPNVGNPFFSEILAGIESVMTQAAMNVLILDSKGTSSRADIEDYLISQRADGIICLDGLLQPDESDQGCMVNLPVVYGCEWPASLKDDKGDFISVRADNKTGASLAVDHLVSLGHQKIGHVAGPADNVLTTDYRLKELNLPIEDDWFFEGDFTIDSGCQAARQWMALNDRPTAVFCASDMMAIGLIAELKQHKISVPDELSVVGFDDIDIATYYDPPLTTIRQPRRQLGEEAASTLLQRLNRENVATIKQPLAVELIERSSTAGKNLSPI